MINLHSIRNEPQENPKMNDDGQKVLDQWMISPDIVSPEEILGELLVSLKIDIPDIQVALIISIEGAIITSKRFDYTQDDRVIEAMTAAIVSVAEQASLELDKGNPTEFIIRSNQGLLFIKRLSEVHLLIILTQPGVRLELLEDSVQQISPNIRQHLP